MKFIISLFSIFMSILTAISAEFGLQDNHIPEIPEESITEVSHGTETTDFSAPESDNGKYEKYNGQIGVYHCENVLVDGSDDEYTADMRVDLIGNSEENKIDFINHFEENFGFEPTAEINCTYIGKYVTDDTGEVRDIYRYEIKDSTYPLITDEFYVIKRKICTDGSPWVGFPVPIDFYNEDFTQETYDLIPLMKEEFCEWTGYDMDYIYANRDKFLVDIISVAGKMRTADGQVKDVAYRYIRGINMPVYASEADLSVS